MNELKAPMRNEADLANDDLCTYSHKFPWHSVLSEFLLIFMSAPERYIISESSWRSGSLAVEEANTPDRFINSLGRQMQFGGRQWEMIHVLIVT